MKIYRLLVPLFCLGLCLPPPLPAQQGRLSGILIKPENILFVGNKLFPSTDLRNIFCNAGIDRSQVPVDQLDLYNAPRINLAYQTLLTFYRNRGFLKVQIQQPSVDFTQKPSPTQVQLTLSIVESLQYHLREVKMAGARALTEPFLRSLLNLQPNSLLNLSKIDQGLASIRDTYLTLGFLDVQVNSSLETPPGASVADLLLNLQEGIQYRVGKIEMVGSLPFQTSLYLEFFPLQKGDIFGEKIFNSALNALNNLGMTPKLTTQDIDFIIDRNRGVVDLVIYLAGKSLGKK